MDMTGIHDYARRFLSAHGELAEFEAAQRAAECDRLHDSSQTRDWRRIQAAIREMRGPYVS